MGLDGPEVPDPVEKDIQEILDAAGVIEDADIRPDGIATVVIGDRKVVFGEATTETGETAPGWDATSYFRDPDAPDGWRELGYVYCETDAEMIFQLGLVRARETGDV